MGVPATIITEPKDLSVYIFAILNFKATLAEILILSNSHITITNTLFIYLLFAFSLYILN